MTCVRNTQIIISIMTFLQYPDIEHHPLVNQVPLLGITVCLFRFRKNNKSLKISLMEVEA
jgi:hypothetical protein